MSATSQYAITTMTTKLSYGKLEAFFKYISNLELVILMYYPQYHIQNTSFAITKSTKEH